MRNSKSISGICILALLLSILPIDLGYFPPLQIPTARAAIDDPTDISGLKLWLDADDESTLHTDAACTSAAPADGANVLCWEDKSGNDDDVTEISGDCDEETSGTQTCGTPVLRQNEYNGTRNALEFVRSESDALRHTLASSWSGQYTIFIVFEQVGTPDTFYSFFSNGNPAGTDHLQIDTINDGGTKTFRVNVSGSDNPLFEEFSNSLKLYAVRGTASATEAFADGEQTDTSTDTTGRTFEMYRINQNRNGSHRNNAKIAEVIVYDSALTNCQLSDVYRYLGDKYGRNFGGGTPGGLPCTELELWLKADAGVTGTTNVSAWADQSSNDLDVSQGTSANQPALTTDAVNFNPALTFTQANDDHLDGTYNAALNGSNMQVFLAHKLDGGSDYRAPFSSRDPGSGGNDVRGYNLYVNGSGNYELWTKDGGAPPWDILSDGAAGSNYEIVTLDTTSGDGTANQNIYVDGALKATTSSAEYGAQTANGWRVGASHHYSGGVVDDYHWNGDIAEQIVFSVIQSTTNQRRVESYLAIKYGMTLSGGTISYLSGSGDTVWDATTNSSYGNDIAGIARDDQQDLLQLKSQSINSDAIVTMSGFTANIADHEFLLWGNDNGSTAETTSNVPSSIERRLTRIWRVDETGDIGNTTIEFDITGITVTGTGASDFMLITDSDATFTSGATTTGATTAVGNTITFSNVNLSDGQYFALGTERASPGDVGSGLLLWLDAEDPDADGNSANNPSDGASVNTWYDRSGNNNDATVYSGEAAATYQSGVGDTINGVPVLYFDRTGQHDGSVYEVPGVDIRAGTNEDITIFTVYQPQEAALGTGEHYGLWGADNGAWDRFFATNHKSFGDGIDDGLASLGPTYSGVVVPDAGTVDTVRLMAAVYDGAVSGGVNSGPTSGSSIYFNGTVITKFTDETDDLAAQDRLFIGWDGDDGAYDGDIAEVIVYNRILTCEEFNDVTEYLSNKYGQSFNSIAPGGVSCGLELWLKANDGVTLSSGNVTTWEDQTGNNFDFTQGTSANQPALSSAAMNFNDVIRFDGSNDFLEDDDGESYINGETAMSTFVVTDTDVQNNGYIILNSNASSNSEAPWGLRYDSSGFETGHSNIMKFGIGTTTDSDKLYEINKNNAAGTDPLIANMQWTSGSTPTMRLNHDTMPTLEDNAPSTIGGSLSGGDYMRLGHQSNAGHNWFDGDMAEVILYNVDVSATDRTKIASYLGVKYGITLSGGTVNYLSASGTAIWDATTNSSYPNDIAGIGREDDQGLSQLKSHSINSDSVVTMSGAAANIADHEFLLWGNDNGSLVFGSRADTKNAEDRIGRIWRAQEFGDVGAVTLTMTGSFVKPGATYYLLKDDDTNFADGDATEVTWGTATSDGVSFSNVSLTSGEYFTLGQKRNNNYFYFFGF